MMPRARPQLSITLPRNFTFHYTEGEEPKTPEREIPLPIPRSPPRNGNAFRIKRRSRAAVTSLFETQTDQVPANSDENPIPTIETPISVQPTRPIFQQRATEPVEGYLNPVSSRKCMTLPRTPILQHRILAANGWEGQSHQDLGDSISRPMSACSLLSDSSEESNGSLTSYPAGDGSCTSPESDAADPFKFPSIKKSKAKQWAALARNPDALQDSVSVKKTRTNWTPEMDNHLWSTYLIYLQDPTVTPFKTLPGVAPPLGVCHRVAREARRSWQGGKSRRCSSFSPKVTTKVCTVKEARPSSPETIRANRSGSNTPTAPVASSKVQTWPKSGSSTRRRLRHLCKSKPTIAPHYQRLLQSRSPSPFSSPRGPTRSHSRLSEVSSPITQASSVFNTRDVQLSLMTSTAASMQPSGPLAQLACAPALATTSGGGPKTKQRRKASEREWFNEPPVPWASTPAIPSDIDAGHDIDEQDDSMQSCQLGSPFGSHTWGPSRSRQRIRPSTARMQSSDASTIGPSLRSPVRLHDTFPYPGVQKRRARHPLEDEVSPGGSNIQQELLDNLFGNRPEGRHRRVRSRGFSLGDVTTPNPLENLFTPPSTDDQKPSPDNLDPQSGQSLEPPRTPNQVRLGSPFGGISPRPSRTPSRHMASTSLGGHEPFSSIGETLGQASTNDLSRSLLYR